MSYTSLIFLVLIAGTVLLYFIFPLKARWAVLLTANMVFYLYAGWEKLLILLGTALAAWLVGLRLDGINDRLRELKKKKKETPGAGPGFGKEERARCQSAKKTALVLGVLLVLVILGIVKYTNFVSAQAAQLMHKEPKVFSLIVPLGVSFYSFQIIAYLNDVNKGKIRAQKNFLKFLLFVSFFPTVVQGPISRYAQLAPQLYEGSRFSFENLRDGATLILWGFAKKLILAERLNTFVSTIFDNYKNYYGPIFLVAAAVYSIQIYADFDGCMNIASGTARIFGIELAPNFIQPYFSRTLPEFWRRWHATLGSWFRDYVFFPFSISGFSQKLNRNARKTLGEGAGRIISATLPILVVWILTGIWHGAEWKYVVWGLFHGSLIMLSTVFTPMLDTLGQKLHVRTDCFSFRLFQSLRTFFLCCVGRVFFRADSVRIAFNILRRSLKGFGIMFMKPHAILHDYGLNTKNILVALLMGGAWLIVSLLKEQGHDVIKDLNRQNLIFRWILLYMLLIGVVVLGKYGPGYDVSAFIYEKF